MRALKCPSSWGLVALLLGAGTSIQTAFAQDDPPTEELPTVASYLEDADEHEGFLRLAWKSSQGRLTFVLNEQDLEREWLYQESLASGMGSNDIGLDRGQLGTTALIQFQRIGPKVLVMQPNLDYRAESTNPAERKAVADAFAQSVLASLPVVAQSGESIVVDATDWLVADTHGVSQRLKQTEQGEFALDPLRSSILPDALHAFPRNTDIEVLLTFQSSEPGDWVAQVTPTPTSVSVRTHHSFVELPGPGYQPRRYHPSSGYFPFSYWNYAAALGESQDQVWVPRHRLIKKFPGAAVSVPVEPIVYYLDPGTPEPVRSALLEGARWWDRAFQAAGFKDAFQVEMLPPDAHPLDVRYNVIQWVHRATRGWSYGSSVRDPRTGEIIKGHITLGSLRVRQDMAIAAGLLGPYGSDEGADEGAVEAMALARLRQLSAHEVGHTLGLAHNFAGSNSDRSSVMDYPHPLLTQREGVLNLQQAYDTDIGEWDKFAITYGYAEFDEPAEAALPGVVEAMRAAGLAFVADPGARGPDAAHAGAHLWDNGADPVEELNRLQQIRALALDQFSVNVLAPGTPISEMETVLVPVYLLHRYQLEAVAKQVGGLTYQHAIAGQGDAQLKRVSAADQRAALNALGIALSPPMLALPDSVIEAIPPPAYGYGRHREHFAHRTGSAFDAIAPAEALAQLISTLVLSPQRTARIAQQHAMDAALPSVPETVQTLLQVTWFERPQDDHERALQEAAGWVVINELLRLQQSDMASASVRGVVYGELQDLKRRLERRREDGIAQMAAAHIEQQLSSNAELPVPAPVKVPPGSPIGTH